MKKLFAYVFIVFVVMFFSGVYILKVLGTDNNNNNQDIPKQEYSSTVWDASEKKDKDSGKKDSKKTEKINILLLGLDEYGYRSDVILLFNYSPKNSSLNILSLERDARVNFNKKYMKLNAVYAAGGINALQKQVKEITGLEVDNYAIVNFKSFRKIIDTLDGVMFDVPFNMRYDDPTQNLHINLKKGKQLLDGKKAEQLVRYRKGNKKGAGYSDGDVGRIKMQQDFMKALVEQKANMKYISKADDIYKIVKEEIETDITLDLATSYLYSAAKISGDKINAFIVPGESVYINDIWYFIIDKEKTRQIVRDNFY